MFHLNCFPDRIYTRTLYYYLYYYFSQSIFYTFKFDLTRFFLISLCTLNFFWYLFLVFALRLWFKFFGTIQLPAAFFFLFCFFFPLYLWKTYLSRNKVAISSSESPFNTSNYDKFSPISSVIDTLVLVFHFVFRLGHIILSSCILELMKLLFSL